MQSFRITAQGKSSISGKITIERMDDSKHIVPRSGLKRLGYTKEQRETIRAIKAELKEVQ